MKKVQKGVSIHFYPVDVFQDFVPKVKIDG